MRVKEVEPGCCLRSHLAISSSSLAPPHTHTPGTSDAAGAHTAGAHATRLYARVDGAKGYRRRRRRWLCAITYYSLALTLTLTNLTLALTLTLTLTQVTLRGSLTTPWRSQRVRRPAPIIHG